MDMRTWKLILISFYLLITSDSAFSEDAPNDSVIKNKLLELTPSFVELDDFDVKVSDTVGTKVNPVFLRRFEADMELTEDTYVYDEKATSKYDKIQRKSVARDVIRSAIFVRPKHENGYEFRIYGTSKSRAYSGKWLTTIDLEEGPFGSSSLGESLTMLQSRFKDTAVIVSNTKGEKDFYEEIAKLEAERRSLLSRISSLGEILPGVWKWNHSKIYVEYFPNNTFKGYKTNGDIYSGKWQVYKPHRTFTEHFKPIGRSLAPLPVSYTITHISDKKIRLTPIGREASTSLERVDAIPADLLQQSKEEDLAKKRSNKPRIQQRDIFQSQHPEELIGKWKWNNGAVSKFMKDGTYRRVTAKGHKLRGVWKVLNNNLILAFSEKNGKMFDEQWTLRLTSISSEKIVATIGLKKRVAKKQK